jgi:hypothetical protein
MTKSKIVIIVFSYQFSVFSFQLSVFSCQFFDKFTKNSPSIRIRRGVRPLTEAAAAAAA